MKDQAAIREEGLKNRVAKLYFGKYDCDRIVGIGPLRTSLSQSVAGLSR